MIEFDKEKDEVNRLKHGISLARAEDFEIDTTIIDPCPSERRFRSFGRIEGRLYCLIFTPESGTDSSHKPASCAQEGI